MTDELKQVAAENRQIAAAGHYRTAQGAPVEIAQVLAAAVTGTREHSHADSDPQATRPDGTAQTVIEVTDEDSLSAARRLITDARQQQDARVAVLNFASATNPGGGYLNGATGQEEDLCCRTLLYPCLLAHPGYYAAHRSARDPFYSNRLMYSPGVPVIRDEHSHLTAVVMTVDVITCAAPNAGIVLRDCPTLADQIPARLAERAGSVLAAAAYHGVRRLVLGAWGCGAFRNDPQHAAAAFRGHLSGGGRYRDVFEHVVFAVLDRSPERRNLRAFEQAFAD